MGPFPPSCGNLYILLTTDYVSKWFEPIACQRNDANTIVWFVQRNILNRFGALGPSSVIREGILLKKLFAKLITRYGIRNAIGLAYHL